MTILVPIGALAADAWVIVPSPNSPTTQDNHLRGTACVTTSDCWAVGFSGTIEHTLVERWDGSTWTIFPSPNPNPASVNDLEAVTCVASNDCWAVGDYVNLSRTAYVTLAEHWDGHTWMVIPSPNGTTTNSNFVRGVTCVSTSDCWMAGWFLTSSSANSSTLTEHWDGTRWTVISSPNSPMAGYNFLYGVACTSSSACWTAGYYLTTTVGGCCHQTLIEKWDGNVWTVATSVDNLPVQDNYLFGITCATPSECWAVGFYLQTGGIQNFAQTLIERWDGNVWALLIPSPDGGTMQPNILYSVSCASASDCWAAGYYLNHPPLTLSFVAQTLTAHWDGTLWSVAASPNQNTNDNTLYSVACVATSDCWAAGEYYTGKLNQTLIEAHLISPATPIPEVPVVLVVPVAGAVAIAAGALGRRRGLARGARA